MSKRLTEEFVRQGVMKYLSKKNYEIWDVKTLREKGVDLIMVQRKKRGQKIFIEAKGHTRQGIKNSLDVGLGQLVINMTKTGRRYILGLPITYQDTVRRYFPDIWRIAKKLKLSIFFVDNQKKVIEYNYEDMKAHKLAS